MAPAEQRLVLPPHISKFLFRSSVLSVASVLGAAYNERFDCMGCASLVMLTSLNYWRHPVLGLRRNLDITAAVGSLCYQVLFVAPEAPKEACFTYYGTVAAGVGCYGGARYFTFGPGGDKAKRIGTMWHVGLHLWGNVGNLLLYDAVGQNRMEW